VARYAYEFCSRVALLKKSFVDVSRVPRRLASASAAAPSPDTPPPARLLDLPTELLVRALSHCDPADIARIYGSRTFGAADGGGGGGGGVFRLLRYWFRATMSALLS